MQAHRPPRRVSYIWQMPDWPSLSYDAASLALPLAEVHRAQGQLVGHMAELGLAQREQATLQVLTQEVIKTSEIEGKQLNLDAVRSSVARKLGMDIGALAPSDRYVDGVVDVVLDAARNFDLPLTQDRPFGWHAALVYHGLQRQSTHSGGRVANRCQWPDAGGVGDCGPRKSAFHRATRQRAASANRRLFALVQCASGRRRPHQGWPGASVAGHPAPV